MVAEPSTSQKYLKFCGGRAVHPTETSGILWWPNRPPHRPSGILWWPSRPPHRNFRNSVMAEPSTSQKLLKFCGGRAIHLTEASEILWRPSRPPHRNFCNYAVAEPSTSQKLLKICGGRPPSSIIGHRKNSQAKCRTHGASMGTSWVQIDRCQRSTCARDNLDRRHHTFRSEGSQGRCKSGPLQHKMGSSLELYSII